MSDLNGPAPAHRNVASIRPGPSTTGAPNSPHTPLRTISSAYGSPSALRAEEDCILIEFGARYLRAGFAGDATPKAVVDFGPEQQRRAGDYRQWEVDFEKSRRSGTREKSWGEHYELWRPDLRGLDLGLVGDKIDRAVREAFTKSLLIDSRPRRLALVLPSQLPLPLLSIVLDTLFTSFQPPTISLMAAPVLTTIAAGLRSTLVVDIGWAETVVSVVYEYREVHCKRSIRGTKMLGEAVLRMFAEVMDLEVLLDESQKPRSDQNMEALPNFEECEEVLVRMGWCKPMAKSEIDSPRQGLTTVNEEDELRSSMRSMNISDNDSSTAFVSIPLRSTHPRRVVKMPLSTLAEPCERVLFASKLELQDLDDEELPLHVLIYRSLLQLPVDARSICMSRIILVGGGSNIPGLRNRLLDELANFIKKKGWDPVQGLAVKQYQTNSNLQRSRNRQPGPIEVPPLQQSEPAVSNPNPAPIPAAFVEREPDPIEIQLQREAAKSSGSRPVIKGELRMVESLGAWSGGSLLSQLKIPAISVVDREQWQQHGAAGASKTGDVSVSSTRQSMGPSTFKSGTEGRNSWTLGLWG